MTGFGELGIAWPLRDVAWMGAFGAPCPFRLGPRSQYGAGPGIQTDYPAAVATVRAAPRGRAACAHEPTSAVAIGLDLLDTLYALEMKALA